MPKGERLVSLTSMMPLRCLLFSTALLAAPVLAFREPQIPQGSPYCAPPGAKPVFLSPMGEPFRARSGEAYPAIAWFTGADADHDGALSRTEFVGDAERFFKTIDLDHDGRIVPEEVIAYERDIAPEVALYSRSRDYIEAPTRGNRKAGAGYGGAMAAGRYSWLNIPEPVSSADIDFNRVIDAAEFRQAASRRLDTLTQGAGKLVMNAMPRTPIQIAIEGPCRARPKPKKGAAGEHEGGFGDAGDRSRGEEPPK